MENLVRILADWTLVAVLVVAGLAIVRTVPYKKWLSVVPVAVMAGMTSLLVGKIMSFVYQPAIARPFIELGQQPGAAFIDNPGFPSDHALLATVALMALYVLTPYKKLAYVMALVVVTMVIARVVALVHTPLDVIGGILAGLSGVYWYYRK